MAKETAPASGYNRNAKRESFGSAIIQIVVVAALVGGGVFAYAKIQGERKRVQDLALKAREATEGDDSVALLKAKELYAQIGDESKLLADDTILVQMAELEAQLFQAYGIQESKARAEKLVALAKERDIRKAERYAAEAYLQLGAGQAQQAEQTITALTDRGVRHAKLLHALSVAKLAQGKAKEAVNAAQEGQKLSTALVRLPIAEGDALMALGNFSSAASAYAKAIKLNGNHMRARTAVTALAAVSRQGKPELMQKELDRLLEAATTNPAYKGTPPPRVKGFIEYAKGETFLVDNDAQNALAMAEASLATDPGQASAIALKARALAKLGKIEEAKAAFDEALTLAPLSLPIAKAASDVFIRAKKMPEAVAFLDRVVKANPENGVGHVYLSIAQAKAGMAKEATASADAAVDKLGNAHDLAVFAKARAFQASGELDKAREAYGEALGYHGNQEWPELFFEMAQLRLAEKNWEDAIPLYENAIKFWDKQGGALDDIADAYEGIGNAYRGMGGKNAKKAGEFFDKAAQLRKGIRA